MLGPMVEHLELPHPWRLMRTAGWNLGESLGLPVIGYVIGDMLAGSHVGVLAATAVLWLTVAARKLLTGCVPGLLMITAAAMIVQAIVVVATGNMWLFLLQFPLSHLVMAVLFARSAPTRKPLIARMAEEVVALRQPSSHHPGLHRFFQGATWLWAAIFGVLTAGLSVMMVTEPLTLFLMLTTAVTIGICAVGTVLSVLWFFSMCRRTGLRLRFAAA
jgi:hypothetical protein